MSSRGRPATGQIRTHTRRDGLTTFSLRLRVDGTRHTIRLGTEAEGWSRVRAELELNSVQAGIRAGTWTPPRAATAVDDPTLHEFASLWLKRKITDGIEEKTRQDLLWQLGSHILPFLGIYRLSELDRDVIEASKEHKLDERARILAARDAGEPIRDPRGRPRRTLSNGSINTLLTTVGTSLTNAQRHGLIESNPAADVERVPTRRRQGEILEADELESARRTASSASG